jgi:hypothetical protein
MPKCGSTGCVVNPIRRIKSTTPGVPSERLCLNGSRTVPAEIAAKIGMCRTPQEREQLMRTVIDDALWDLANIQIIVDRPPGGEEKDKCVEPDNDTISTP